MYTDNQIALTLTIWLLSFASGLVRLSLMLS
jgi:hypothetical protein